MLTVIIGLHVAVGLFLFGSIIDQGGKVSLFNIKTFADHKCFQAISGSPQGEFEQCKKLITRMTIGFNTTVMHKVAGLHIGVSTVKCTRWQHHIVRVPSTCEVFFPFVGRFVTAS